MRILLLFSLALLPGCAGGPPPADWQLNSRQALNSFQERYLRGDTRAAEIEFERAKAELGSTGKPELLARAELVRCAARAASLEFDDCPAFEALRRDAGAEEIAYADYLTGRAQRAASDDAFSRLVFAGVQFKSGRATPETIASAIEIASAQGWRRPLLAWLGVEEKRAAAAGDSGRAETMRRRIKLILNPLRSQAFQPSRPIEFVVHSAPGGGSDVFARAVAEMAKKKPLLPQPQDVNAHIAAGRMRPIAAFTEKRLAVLPAVPTIREQGIEVPIIANARGILAPPGMGREAIAYWEDFFERLTRTPNWKKYLEENQVEDAFLKGRELGPFLEEQTALMRRVLRQAGVAVAR